MGFLSNLLKGGDKVNDFFWGAWKTYVYLGEDEGRASAVTACIVAAESQRKSMIKGLGVFGSKLETYDDIPSEIKTDMLKRIKVLLVDLTAVDCLKIGIMDVGRAKNDLKDSFPDAERALARFEGDYFDKKYPQINNPESFFELDNSEVSSSDETVHFESAESEEVAKYSGPSTWPFSDRIESELHEANKESAQENNETDITPDIPINQSSDISKDEVKNLKEFFLNLCWALIFFNEYDISTEIDSDDYDETWEEDIQALLTSYSMCLYYGIDNILIDLDDYFQKVFEGIRKEIVKKYNDPDEDYMSDKKFKILWGKIKKELRKIKTPVSEVALNKSKNKLKEISQDYYQGLEKFNSAVIKEKYEHSVDEINETWWSLQEENLAFFAHTWERHSEKNKFFFGSPGLKGLSYYCILGLKQQVDDKIIHSAYKILRDKFVESENYDFDEKDLDRLEISYSNLSTSQKREAYDSYLENYYYDGMDLAWKKIDHPDVEFDSDGSQKSDDKIPF